MSLQNIKTIRKAKSILAGKKVLVRVDFNLPINVNPQNKQCSITDYSRVESTINTLRFLLLECKCQVILISHLGNPPISQKPQEQIGPEFFFINIVQELKSYIQQKLHIQDLDLKLQSFTEVLYDNKTKYDQQDLENKTRQNKQNNNQTNPQYSLTILENLRLYPEEKQNDLEFAKRLSKMANYYINEAFSCCHREHASISAITNYLPSYAGIHLYEEIQRLNKIIQYKTDQKKKIMLILGGKKASTKIKLLQSLAQNPNITTIAVVGGIANSFLKALGHDIKKSFYEIEMMEIIQSIIQALKANNKTLILPQDYIIHDGIIGDIGPQTIKNIINELKKAEITIWNGPAGICEDPRFRNGSLSIAAQIGKQTKNKRLISIIGGGDTIAAINHHSPNYIHPSSKKQNPQIKYPNAQQHNHTTTHHNAKIHHEKITINKENMKYKTKTSYQSFSHVSTGGGAFLAFLENPEKMPGIIALKQKMND